MQPIQNVMVTANIGYYISDTHSGMTRNLLLLPVAVALALAPLPARLVERLYVHGLYAVLQPILTSLSNLAPFAVFDAVVALVLIAWLGLGARDVSRAGWPRAAPRAVLRAAGWTA